MSDQASKEFDAEKKALLRLSRNAISRAQKGIDKLQNQLKRTEEWSSVRHEGLLLQTHMHLLKRGLSKIDIPDWENENQPRQILLNPRLDPKKQVERFFKTSRKLKLGKEPLEKALQKSFDFLKALEDRLRLIEEANSTEELQQFREPPKIEKSIAKSHPYHAFKTASETEIWVGKSAKNNEILTFSLAHGSDWWLHVEGFPGSHVVIKAKKHHEPTPEDLEDAMQLALGYSKAKDQGKADILITQCKFVSRLGKRGSGKVQVSKHQIKRISFDPKRFKVLQSQKI